MDIKNLTNSVIAGRSNDSAKVPSKDIESGTNSTSSNNSADKVTLTNVLSQVRELETKSLDINVDNSSRIAAIKAAIEEGSYQVDPQRIADKLIQTEALFAKA